MIKLLELKFSRRCQTNKIESDWSNSHVTHLRANTVHLVSAAVTFSSFFVFDIQKHLILHTLAISLQVLRCAWEH